MKEAPRVEPLKRVRAWIEAGVAAADPSPASFEVTFIYGIGSTGLPPFECLLAGKGEGDQIIFRVRKAEAGDFFGHLTPPFAALFDRHDEAFFHAHIVQIETPEARDVVKAMAEMAADGHRGSCGCG